MKKRTCVKDHGWKAGREERTGNAVWNRRGRQLERHAHEIALDYVRNLGALKGFRQGTLLNMCF